MLTGRRRFLKFVAGAMASSILPDCIERALALPALSPTGTIEDVQHIVIFMQENRSFDHYFGHLRGVRGYNDRLPIRRQDGRPIWHQPRQGRPRDTVLPFRLQAQTTSAECVLDLDHSWYPTHAALNGGLHDSWPEHKTDMTMGYYERADLPFHYALADAFTVCDAYFCSTPNQTHPNRMYLMSGTVDPGGLGGGPLMDNADYVDKQYESKILPPFTYTTYPERLQAAGISWQIYQQGISDEDDFNGNFGTNVLGNFKQYIEAPAGSPLHDRGMSARTLNDLKRDVLNGDLPQVSWLLPPAAFSEHPKYTPGYGATYIARILDALTANPEVWGRTAFFVTYDENDGYFDHVPPPQPPTPVLPGKSTVDTAGEVHDTVNPLNKDRFHADNLPYGLGPRVPTVVVSPWSKGGYVCSEVFDHTSIIRFIEKRFGVREPNISAWRRAVCGDLTSAFDFSSRSTMLLSLPSTTDFIRRSDDGCKLPPPGVPQVSSVADVTPQEPGTRPARALPYDLLIDETATHGALTLHMKNRGTRGACFYVYEDATNAIPRRYTVEAGKSLDDAWRIDAQPVSLTLTGPNGFFRRYRGIAAALSISAAGDTKNGDVLLRIVNAGAETVELTITDMAYGKPSSHLAVAVGQTLDHRWVTTAASGWYDMMIGVAGLANFERRLSGHVETGCESISDPAASAPVLT